ncbi:hypothetical protein J3F83DRAFT_713038 [Trichoderma novae-zelandiae]
MAPTILIVGATGNTGKGVIRELPALVKSGSTKYRILALNRSLNSSPVSKQLAKVDGAEWLEKDWPEIDVEWLRSQEVEGVVLALHSLPHRFLLVAEDNKTGEQGVLPLLLTADAPVALIGPEDIGTLARAPSDARRCVAAQ